MRIISVTTEYPGPGNPRGGLFVQRRLAALSRIEDVHVIHLEPWFPLLRPRARPTTQNGYPDHPPAVRPGMFYLPGVLKGLDSYWVKKAVVPAIRALEGEGQADLIDAHFGYPEGVGCVKAALKLRLPAFITMRGLERPVLRYRWRGSQLLWALKQCAGIICVSQSLRDLALVHGIDPEKIRVIPNAVDRELFRPGDRDAARATLGIDRGTPLIVCVGMLVHGKGQHLLLQALSRLRIWHSDLRLVLVGGPAHEPSYPESLRQMTKELGLSEAVVMTGSQSPQQVVTWLRAADLFALPTFDEGCCNAILEAMACGLPVVTTPAGDNAVLVEPPHRGLLVPINNAEALAEGIRQALARSWERDRIAQYGAGYTWDEVARQTARFFRERLAAAKP
ncbi:MAG TPA: glycosyltransferase [Gemmataceae bacterium]|nr:glycosyltransferase [Gemmataceae bacterium]